MYRRFDYKNAASQLKCLFPSSQLPRRSHTTPFKLNSLRQEPRPPPDQGSEDMDYEPSYDELRSEANVHAKLRAENFQLFFFFHSVSHNKYSLTNMIFKRIFGFNNCLIII